MTFLKPLRLLITGSTGFVGRHLLRKALQDPNWSEIILPVRNHQKLLEQLRNDHLEKEKHRLHVCSVSNNRWKLDDIHHIDLAIHSAGLTFSRTRDPYFSTHIEGSLHLLESLPKECPLLVLSSQAAAGPSSSIIPTRHEYHSEQPISWYGQSKLAMEQKLSLLAYNRLLILRPPMILGPGDRAILPLFKMAHGPVRFKPGLQKKQYSWIAVDDVCEAILLAAKSDWSKLPARIYFVTHSKMITDLELLEAAAAVVKARGINVRLPHSIIQLISIMADKIPRLREALPSLGRDRVKEVFEQCWVVDGSAFERDFHWQAHRGLTETLEQTAAWISTSVK